MTDNNPIPSNGLGVPNMELLNKMRQVARMKDKAEAMGAGFIGGFVDDDGQVFMQTNLDDEGDALIRANIHDMLGIPNPNNE